MSARRWAAAGLRIFVACVAFSALGANPVEPERLSEARAVVKAMEVDKQLDQMIEVMSQTLTRQLVQAGGLAGHNPRVAQIVVGESMAVSRENVTRPGGILDAIAQVHAEKFSLEELRQIRAFYESPVCKRLKEETPEMMQRVIQQAVAASRDTMPGLCARVKQRLQHEHLAEAQTFSCPAVWS
jgi:hypothetical protein